MSKCVWLRLLLVCLFHRGKYREFVGDLQIVGEKNSANGQFRYLFGDVLTYYYDFAGYTPIGLIYNFRKTIYAYWIINDRIFFAYD